jgi:hypothetical protein
MFIHIQYHLNEERKFLPMEGTISFVGPKSDNWAYSSSMSLKDLPAKQLAVYQGITTLIQSGSQPWVASQIHAFPTATATGAKAVSLHIEAIHDTTNAIRVFTPKEDPNLLVEGDEAYSFFDYFTK